MNVRISFLTCLLCMLQTPNYAQLTFPYFQNFEDRSFINDPNINLDVNGPEPLPRDEINVTYGYGYSWEVVESPNKMDNALKLTAHGNDHNKKAYYPRSRSQVTFLLDNTKPLFISYQIYVPDN